MAEPFVGEIRMFAGNFAPPGWALCDGQLLAVSQNDALFSVIGTIYGGDGETTFGLPDLRGRVPIHKGQGPGLSNRAIGARLGQERVTLVAGEVPSHTHALQGVNVNASTRDPAGNLLANAAGTVYVPQDPDAGMLAGAVLPGSGALPHDNMMPCLGIHFIIALFGVFPSVN